MATIIHLPPEVEVQRLRRENHRLEDALHTVWQRLITLEASVQGSGKHLDSWTDEQLRDVSDLAAFAANHYTGQVAS
ncbi:hypothetical protein FK530_22830 [Tsukamurella conjunctivitidis]|uniref:Uncharacterized protein n=1 Tax=Tsukamurella conjunctivitidis TaxID=2592068 RepID=A0A5C5RSP2_9ACTN|nr:hypothetical protein [Tsukamurella conjunctivitidis]TWS25558.1 hypothetical protein FK530_22830 [Tsukamurella conjunctivitidis]